MSPIQELKRWLSMLRRASEAAPATGDVLNYVGNNQVQWRSVVACRVTHDADQSINDSTWTALNHNTERFDYGSMHDTVTNNTRITFAEAGVYYLGANVGFDTSAVGDRRVRIRENGNNGICNIFVPAAVSGRTMLNASCIYAFAAGEYAEVEVWQDSGGALNLLQINNASPEFMAFRVR